jgi:Uncharacterised BCR, YnfA/UPF0060 family
LFSSHVQSRLIPIPIGFELNIFLKAPLSGAFKKIFTVCDLQNGITPDKFDWFGSFVALLGVMVIMYAPRN